MRGWTLARCWSATGASVRLGVGTSYLLLLFMVAGCVRVVALWEPYAGSACALRRLALRLFSTAAGQSPWPASPMPQRPTYQAREYGGGKCARSRPVRAVASAVAQRARHDVCAVRVSALYVHMRAMPPLPSTLPCTVRCALLVCRSRCARVCSRGRAQHGFSATSAAAADRLWCMRDGALVCAIEWCQCLARVLLV